MNAQTTTSAVNRHGSAVVTTPSDREIQITRVFDASASAVFRAWTTPDLVKRWWGSEMDPLVICDINLTIGGSWRYVTRNDQGVENGWHGVYREIDQPQRLVSTEVYEGYPDAEAVNTLMLDEIDGTTTMKVIVLHASKENRDGHLESGMEPGMQIVLDRFEDLVRIDG
jgi:uncharacterized protein YndB with AHSA1/START domain